MKAISLWQPWASLIACGAKPYETRSWAPPRELIGTTIAIHAAKRVDRDAAKMATDLMLGRFDDLGGLSEQLAASWGGDDGIRRADHLTGIFGAAVMPIGCVVCTARLEAAFQVGDPDENAPTPAARIVRRLSTRPMLEYVNVPYDEFGDYSAGRWAWLLGDVKPLKPPARAIGHQGFFELPQGWLAEA